MSETERDTPVDGPLNTALKQTTETVHDTTRVTPTPFDTASAKNGEGEGWPLIWLVVGVLCVLVTVYLLVG